MRETIRNDRTVTVNHFPIRLLCEPLHFGHIHVSRDTRRIQCTYNFYFSPRRASSTRSIIITGSEIRGPCRITVRALFLLIERFG